MCYLVGEVNLAPSVAVGDGNFNPTQNINGTGFVFVCNIKI